MQCARDNCGREALSFSIYCGFHRPARGTIRRRAGGGSAGGGKKAAPKKAAKKGAKKRSSKKR
jgi:hypothetical protein